MQMALFHYFYGWVVFLWVYASYIPHLLYPLLYQSHRVLIHVLELERNWYSPAWKSRLSPSKSFPISGAMSPLQTSSDHPLKEELPSLWTPLYISAKALSLSHIIFYICACSYCFPPPKKEHKLHEDRSSAWFTTLSPAAGSVWHATVIQSMLIRLLHK